jgi:hypothetical protein
MASYGSRDDFLDGAAERRVITTFRRDGIEECLYEDPGALGWAPAHIRNHCARPQCADRVRPLRGLAPSSTRPQHDLDHTVFFVPELLVHRRRVFEAGGVRDDEARVDLAVFDKLQ